MRDFYLDLLIVAVGARMVVGPGDRSGKRIIRNVPRGVWLRIPGMKKVGAANAAQSTERCAEVFVIARGHDAAAPLPEARDALTISHGQPIAGVNRKQPKLGEVGRI